MENKMNDVLENYKTGLLSKLLENHVILLTDDVLEHEGFEKNLGDDDGEEYHYWTKEINEIYLISNTSEEDNGIYTLYIFEYNLPVCKTYLDLILLINLFTKYLEK
jgi:Zn-dependent peptidase ImmA (M78 family)